MAAYINLTGKIFGASLAAWLGSKLLERVSESRQESSDPLEGVMDPGLRASLAALAQAGEVAGFVVLLKSNGYPQDTEFMKNLWFYLGGKRL